MLSWVELGPTAPDRIVRRDILGGMLHKYKLPTPRFHLPVAVKSRESAGGLRPL
jgi:hypothetical protein